MNPTPASPTTEQPAIEAVRGLAAVMVLCTHYVPLIRAEGAGAWGLASVGVDVFFVLSGFVFARTLAAGHEAVTAPALLPFLVRRVFRLYPLYLVALLVYAALRPETGRWEALPEHLAMLHTTSSLTVAAAYNAAFWSLPPEVEYYLLLPLLAVMAGWMAQSRLPALGLLLLMALLLKLALVALARPGEPADSLRSILTIHAPGLLIEFLLGAAVAIWGGHLSGTHLGAPLRHGLRRVIGLAALVALPALILVYQFELSTPALAAEASPWLSGQIGLWAALITAGLMLAWLPSPSGKPSRAADAASAWWHPVARVAGHLSYGVYLFHNAAPALILRLWPQAQGWAGGWALVGLSLLLTLLVAALLNRLVEAPARRLGRQWADALATAMSTRMSGLSR